MLSLPLATVWVVWLQPVQVSELIPPVTVPVSFSVVPWTSPPVHVAIVLLPDLSAADPPGASDDTIVVPFAYLTVLAASVYRSAEALPAANAMNAIAATAARAMILRCFMCCFSLVRRNAPGRIGFTGFAQGPSPPLDSGPCQRPHLLTPASGT